MAPRFLVAVVGSTRADVAPELVHARLDAIDRSMRLVGTPWSLLHAGRPGVEAAAAAWADAHGIEHAAATDDSPAAHWDPAAAANRAMLALLRRADEAGWATRLEAFPGRLGGHAWDLVREVAGAGLNHQVTHPERNP